MNETKLRQLFKNSADAYLNTIDESVEQGMSEDCFIKAVNLAINFIPCCTELKGKEAISFEEWLFVNNYKKLFDYFVKDAVSFTESELMKIYNNQVMRL